MVSATWDGEVQIVYLNGIKIARSTDLPHGEIDDINGGSLNIGWHRDNNPIPFKGSLDDIRIYNRALSEAEVKELYEFEKVN